MKQLAGLEIPRAAIRKSVFIRQRTAQEGDVATAQKNLADLPGWPDGSVGLAEQPCCCYAHTRERERYR